jgi:hypothetical protein
MHSILLKRPPIFHQSSEIPSIYRLLSMLGFHHGFSIFHEILIKDKIMKKKLLVLLIAAIPMLMPNLASAIAIHGGDAGVWCILPESRC